MAPKIVNKDQRREELGLMVYNSIIKMGIKSFSIDAFIKEHKMGKSSFYNYFSSKDEAIYYVLLLITQEYIQECRNKLDLSLGYEKNLYLVFDTYINTNEKRSNNLSLYKEYFVIYQNFNNKNIGNLNKYYFTNLQLIIKEIIEDAISKKLLKKEALEFSESLLMTAEGMMFYSFTVKDFDLPSNIKKHINNFIKLLGNK